jgi:transposase
MPIRNARRPLKKLRALARDPEAELWAADEVHFQQYGSRCRLWVPPENRDPLVWHHPTREGVGYYGAVRLRDGRFVFRREEQRFNAETFWAFLRQLRSASRPSRRQVVVLDNAAYHHARLHKPWRLRHADRFGLEFLPPYSPDLNPAERVWRLTRRRCLHNRYFPTLAGVIHTVEEQFIQWCRGNETLRRLCAII